MSRRVLFLVASLGLLIAGSLATVPAALGGGGCHAEMTGAAHNDAATSVVRMDVCSFEPTVARVPVGAEVTFLNTAELDHVVAGRGNSWGSVNLRPGMKYASAFNEAGVFPYSCPLHPGMVGAIVVGDAAMAPAAAVDTPADEVDTAGAATSTAATATGGTGVDPALAVGLGGLSGLAILGLGLLAVRRRRDPDPA
jgi:plastocyanin